MVTLGEIARSIVISLGRAWRRVVGWVLRRTRYRRIVASDQRFRALIEHAPDGIFIVNDHGQIELANAQAASMFGYESDELIGENLIDLVPQRFRDVHRVHMKGYMSDAGVRPMGSGLDLFALRKDGSEFPVEISLGPLETDRGQVISCHVRDITVRKEIEVELRQRADALEQSNRDLEQFAYVASHDLSAPLRTVEGFTTLLGRRYHDALDEQGNELIEHTLSSVRRMRALIDDLLTYSRVSAAADPFRRVDSNAVVALAMGLLDAQIDEAGATVTVEDLPAIYGDEGRLTQLFQNVIANGIKFARDEPPLVEVAAAADGNAMWRFTVRDNGIGIDPRNAERIFAMFERLHGVDEFEGTGIGLAICKRIVEQHGGEIAADPAPGGGTIVSFTLPGTAD